MKSILFILLVIVNLSARGQSNTVTISGRVSSTINNEPVKHAVVRLKLPGGISFSQQTDTSGTYTFTFEADSSVFCSISLATNKYTVSKTFKNGFLASKESGKFEIHKDTAFVKDFVLVPVSCGPGLPVIMFNYNSIKSCNDSINKLKPTSLENFDDVILWMVTTLKDYPETVFEVCGHASTIEKNYEYLALYRAQLIREILITKGIDPKRLQAKGYGNHKLLVTDVQIKKAKTKEEKMALHAKNQRVTFKVLRWDFK